MRLEDKNGVEAHAGTRGVRKDVRMSIVVPAYNERDRLSKTILETIGWCRENLESYEILIVDDGSADDTLEIARGIGLHDPNVKALACPHLGKGAAVRMGMLNAAGIYILFMDADGATPLAEIPKLARKIDEGFPVAIGSRAASESSGTIVEKTPFRKFISQIFGGLVGFFGVRGIADTQCGFKMFRYDAARSLFLKQKIEGFAFDVEILYLCRRLSCAVAEVPINWFDQKGSKVRVVRDSLTMLKDVCRVRWIHRKTTA
jgi:dolichyl-phosphate beta-glucosyltransferase